MSRFLSLPLFIATPVTGPNIELIGRILAPSAETPAPSAPAMIAGGMRPGRAIWQAG